MSTKKKCHVHAQFPPSGIIHQLHHADERPNLRIQLVFGLEQVNATRISAGHIDVQIDALCGPSPYQIEKFRYPDELVDIIRMRK